MTQNQNGQQKVVFLKHPKLQMHSLSYQNSTKIEILGGHVMLMNPKQIHADMT